MVGARGRSTGVLAIAVANLPPDLRYVRQEISLIAC